LVEDLQHVGGRVGDPDGQHGLALRQVQVAHLRIPARSGVLAVN
jgi:hypothetical protein